MMSEIERISEREFEAEFERLQKENTELKQQYDNEREWKLIYSKENVELKKQKGVVIAEGLITEDLPQLKIYFINGKQINSMFKKFSGKKGIIKFIEDNK